MTTVTINLPDDVARSAEQAGLLSGEKLAAVMRELVREQAARKFDAAVQAFNQQPPTETELTPTDIQNAIDAARRH